MHTNDKKKKKKKNIYRKNPKISDTRKFAVITLKVEQDDFSFRVMHPKDVEGIANSVDPDQTAPRISLIWVCTVRPDLSVRKLRNITVSNVKLN